MSTFTGVSLPSAKVERPLFLGPKIPLEVKELLKVLPSMEKDVFRRILEVVVDQLEGLDLVGPESLYDLTNDHTPLNDVIVVFAGLDVLLRTARRQSKLKAETFKEDLAELNVEADKIEDLRAAAFGAGRLEGTPTMGLRAGYPTLTDLSWRLDVTISDSSVSRVLEPRVQFEATLNDGETKHFGVGQEQFQQLRFAAASLLQQMDALEAKSAY